MEELTIMKVDEKATFNFTDERLQELSSKIAEGMNEYKDVYNSAKERSEAVNRTLAPLFGEVARDKLYKNGNFKSLAEYAESTFGIKKAFAHMLANVGMTFFLTEDADCKVLADTFTVSKLAELLKADKSKAVKALVDGELNEDSTSDECRSFTSENRVDGGKEKLVQTFRLRVITAHEHETPNFKTVLAEDITKDEMYTAATRYINSKSDREVDMEVYFVNAKLRGDKPSASMHFIGYGEDMNVFMFEYVPYIPSKSNTKKTGDNISALKEALLSMTAEERMAFLKMVDGSAE